MAGRSRNSGADPAHNLLVSELQLVALNGAGPVGAIGRSVR